MARVITVAQQKGGAGKTTLAANLASGWAIAGLRVAVVDIDPQRTLARWHALRPPQAAGITLAEAAGWRLPTVLDALARSQDVVLIDSPPQIDLDARRALRAASLVLVPVQPSPPDVWAAEGTLALAAEERRPAWIVLNRVPAGTRLRATVLADLASRRMPVLAAALGNRSGFAAAFARGLGVAETEPKSAACAELRALLTELDTR